MAQIRTIVPSAVSDFRNTPVEAGGGFRLLAGAMDTAYEYLKPKAIQEMTEKGDALGRDIAKQQIGDPAGAVVQSTMGGQVDPNAQLGADAMAALGKGDKLHGTDPRINEVMQEAAANLGITLGVSEGLRSEDRQRQMVAEGKSQTMNSKHRHGAAVDYHIVGADGKPNWDFEAYRPLADEAKRVAAAKGYAGFEWGGDWKTLKDGVHFQFNDGSAALIAAANPEEKPARYREAIASIESRGTGDYAAIGPKDANLGRPLGRYQIMEANLPAWSQEALGREVTVDEFLADGKLQDAIFDHKFGGYVAKYGEKGAAEAWFAGEGGVGKNSTDSLGTSTGSYGEKFVAALGSPGVTMSTSGGAAETYTPTMLREADGKLTARLFGPSSNPILAAHDAAAGVAYQSDVFLKASQDFMGLSEQFALDPDGFKQAADEYVKQMVGAAPDDFRMDIRANLEKEAGRRFLGIMDEKQRDIRQRANNSSGALADKWADDLASAIASGNPDEIAAARTELGSVLSARERLPGLSWTPEQSANVMAKAEEAGRAQIKKAQDEQTKTWKSALSTVVKAAKEGLYASDETILDNPMVQQLLPDEWREAAAFTTLRDQLPTFNSMNPAQQAAALAEMKGQPVVAEWEVDLYGAAEKAAAANATAWKEDPIKRAGEVLTGSPPPPLPAFDPAQPEDFMAALSARAEYGQRLVDGGYTNREVYLSKEEAKMIGGMFGKDVPPEMKAVAAGAVVGAMGEDAAGFFKQISTSDPVIPHVGALMAKGGDPSVATEALQGQSLLDQKVVQAPTAAAVSKGMSKVETALRGAPGALGAMDGVKKTAVAIYAARIPAGADEETQAQVMDEAWQAALGQSNSLGRTTGGVQEVGGNDVLLPPNVAGEDLDAALKTAFGDPGGFWSWAPKIDGRPDMWAAAAGGVPALGGEPLDPSVWSSGEVVLTPVGGARYMLSVNRNGIMIDVGVQGQPSDVPFVFDADALIQAGLVPQ